MVYALGDKGADLLAGLGEQNRSTVSWSAKNRAIKPQFFHHTLLLSSIMIALEISCRRHNDVRVIPWLEILENCPEETRQLKYPQSWRAPVASHRDLGITPDGIFGLHYMNLPQGKNKAYFFLEADRGTMSVTSGDFKGTSFFKKLVTYHATFARGIHTKHFGIRTFRVLTVTTTKARIDSLVAAAKKLEGLQGIFLFIDGTSLRDGDLLTSTWTNGRGERCVRLLS